MLLRSVQPNVIAMKKAKPDRRTERTRQALMRAFIGILLDEGYDAVTVERVVESANVGRSTFYTHYKNKNDILRQSMAHPSTSLAVMVGGDLNVEMVVPVLEHFKDQRKRNRVFFVWPIRPIWVQRLAELIEPRLTQVSRTHGGRPLIPLSLIALQIAESQIALVANWLMTVSPYRTEAVAESLIAGTRAQVAALLQLRASSPHYIPGERLRLQET
jgi:AcrR family transcriptional regulator